MKNYQIGNIEQITIRGIDSTEWAMDILKTIMKAYSKDKLIDCRCDIPRVDVPIIGKIVDVEKHKSIPFDASNHLPEPIGYEYTITVYVRIEAVPYSINDELFKKAITAMDNWAAYFDLK